MGGSLCAQEEDQIIQAAYIRNALHFARWPNQTFESTHTPFRLGFAGKDEALEASLQLAFGQLNHRIQNRKVELIIFQSIEELEKALAKEGSRTCHAIFVTASEEKEAENWIKAVTSYPILMMSDDQNFIEKGGTVSLVPNPDTPKRYLYHIDLKRLRTQKLRFHAEFLRIRSTVKIISN